MIRNALAADIEILEQLSRRTIRDSYTTFLGEEAVASFINSGAVEQYVRDNITDCIVIVQGGKLAGYSVTKGNEIELMMIDSSHHRRRLGTQLLRHIEQILFQNYDDLFLKSFKDNTRANAFYRYHDWNEARTFVDEEYGIEMIEFSKGK